MQLNDQTRAAVIALAQSAFPALVAMGIIHPIDQATTGVFMLFFSNLITFAALAFKSGQSVDTNLSVPLATHNAVVQQALNTPAPSQSYAVQPQDVRDIITEFVRQQKAAPSV